MYHLNIPPPIRRIMPHGNLVCTTGQVNRVSPDGALKGSLNQMSSFKSNLKLKFFWT